MILKSRYFYTQIISFRKRIILTLLLFFFLTQGKDDITGESLCQRPDDQPAIVQARLDQYAAKTKPVIDYYHKLGLLKSFSGDTTNSMWPSIQELVARYA